MSSTPKGVLEITIDPAKVTDAVSLLKTMAHQGRLTVLCALNGQEHTAGELGALTGLSPSALSQHLGQLRIAGLVKTRRDHRHIHYSLANREFLAVVLALKKIFCPAP